MKKVAIVGATGLVGKSIIDNLYEEGMLKDIDLSLYVSDKSAGSPFEAYGKRYTLKELDSKALTENFDIVLFSAGEEVSKLWARRFTDHGAYVIDNSSAFRREKDVPLVVPEINLSAVTSNTKLISNPNCSTIQLVLVLNAIKQLAKFRKVVVSTYQSVSGAGSDALADLLNGTNNFIKEGIKDNLITYIGSINDRGYCTEEDKLMFETNKILGENIDLLATSIRVPTPYCHGESVYIQFDRSIDKGKVEMLLKKSGIKLSDIHQSLPGCHNTNDVYVSRIRKGSDNELLMFITADNLRRGASYNAVMIAKSLLGGQGL